MVNSFNISKVVGGFVLEVYQDDMSVKTSVHISENRLLKHVKEMLASEQQSEEQGDE
jgi:hypothetical protein